MLIVSQVYCGAFTWEHSTAKYGVLEGTLNQRQEGGGSRQCAEQQEGTPTVVILRHIAAVKSGREGERGVTSTVKETQLSS